MFPDSDEIRKDLGVKGVNNLVDAYVTKEKFTQFASGAMRDTDIDKKVRYDLITPIGLRRLAEVYAEGTEKYGEDNWKKGIPASNLINHTLNHIELWRSGDRSEDHLAHALWNLITLIHFEELSKK